MKQLRVLREKRGWSRAELGRRAKINAATVGLVESGRLVPYDSQLVKLARALGTNAARLLDDVRVEGAEVRV